MPLSSKSPSLELAPPNWAVALGGDTFAAWKVDRDAKFRRAELIARTLAELRSALEKRRALYRPTPAVLREVPQATLSWYLRLIGLSNKTLANFKDSWSSFGLTTQPLTIAANLSLGREQSDDQLARLCSWLQSEIDDLWPASQRDPETAAAVVALILGGQLVGQGQNQSGSDTVLIARDLLACELALLGDLQAIASDGKWAAWSPDAVPEFGLNLRFRRQMVLDFTSGGNRPDVMASMAGETVLVGEIKGRKDLSNVWESWMPQLVDHLSTWAREFPSASRVLLGTVITEQMIEGESVRGTRHKGLKQLHKEGQIHGVFNIAKAQVGDEAAVAAISELAAALAGAVP